MADETRPLRMCDACGGVDDHPRHVFAHLAGNAPTDDEAAAAALDNAPREARAQIIAQIRDDATTMRHMDCCRAAGCPDGSCNVVTAGAESLKGDDLVGHLTSLSGEPTTVQGEVLPQDGPAPQDTATAVPQTQEG